MKNANCEENSIFHHGLKLSSLCSKMVDKIPRAFRVASFKGPKRPPWGYIKESMYVPRLVGHSEEAKLKLRRLMLEHLFNYERIITSGARAAVVKHDAEKLITLVKNGRPGALEEARSKVYDLRAMEKLCTELPVRFMRKHGSCVDLYRIPDRMKDGAWMAIVELKGHPYPSLYPALGHGAEPPPDCVRSEDDLVDEDMPLKWKYVEYADEPLPENVPKVPFDALPKPEEKFKKRTRAWHYPEGQHRDLLAKYHQSREDLAKELMMSKKEREEFVAARNRYEEANPPPVYRKNWDLVGERTVHSFDDYMKMLEEREKKLAALQAAKDEQVE